MPFALPTRKPFRYPGAISPAPRRKPRFKAYGFDQAAYIPLLPCNQLAPGSFEHAVHHLVEDRVEDSLFVGLYGNSDFGAAAYPPKMLLKIALFGYSRGLNASRKHERACREHATFMAAGRRPDHSTFAAFAAFAAKLGSVYRLETLGEPGEDA